MYLTKVDEKALLHQTVALQPADWVLAPHHPSRNRLARPSETPSLYLPEYFCTHDQPLDLILISKFWWHQMLAQIDCTYLRS